MPEQRRGRLRGRIHIARPGGARHRVQRNIGRRGQRARILNGPGRGKAVLVRCAKIDQREKYAFRQEFVWTNFLSRHGASIADTRFELFCWVL